MRYGDTPLFINNIWRDSRIGRTLPVLNPATGQEIGRVAHAGLEDLVEAVAAAQKGFETWRNMPSIERAKLMRKAAALVRERSGGIAACMTMEQGKPLREATAGDSALMLGADKALEDLSRAARALRDLAETLEQQPDALLRGREEKP